MNSEDVRNIEQELEVKLPGHYVDYITNFPTSLTGLKEQLGELLFLYDEPEQLILINQHLDFIGLTNSLNINFVLEKMEAVITT